ncbi:putative protein-serine/threonine phosphatase [Helianthus annuus]|nr:putative protein-serine/threonine phosphatase [Helianthus annuus]
MANTSSTSPLALKDVIYKLQLCLLEGIQSETQLLLAGSLLSKPDYHDIVTERSIAQTCGYPLCDNSLASTEPAKKGRYKVSLKEHKVYDLLETRMYCSTKCLVESRTYSESLQEERSLDFDSGKIDRVMRMFELKGEENSSDFGLSKLSIKEKDDRSGGVVSMEEWVGPSNAVEGYVPKNRPGSKVKVGKPKRDGKEIESMFDELNFMSSIIIQGDEYSISKNPSGQTKENKKHTQFNNEEVSKIGEPSGEAVDQPSGSSELKSCLKSKPRSVRRNVTWADDDKQVSEKEKEKEKDNGFGISEDQLAAVEVCAQAEAQHVASGDVVPVSDTGMLPGAVIPEPAQIKWPNKTGIVESDFFESDSWFDTTPEEFVVDLSPFATMFMSMFAWVSSSTLAYIYGGEDSSDYASINGREYPQKIILTDGRSSEIKQTLAACLARSLPGLVLHLRISTPVSTIEYGMGCLLETMSFLDPLPALRMKQWHVILLLFLEALSVSRIPALAPHLTTSYLNKVFEDGQISREEYEVLKDLILPLGRFGMQSGA